MPHDDLAMFANALGHALRDLREAPERPQLRAVLCAMDLTGEQADEVIDFAIERQTRTANDDGLLPT
jgi:hypothetical protein